MIWSMSTFKKTRGLKKSWQLLETIFLRCLAQLGGTLSQGELGIVVSSFFNVRQGSSELWLTILDFIKAQPNTLSVSLKTLVFYALISKGELPSETAQYQFVVDQISKNLELLWNIADGLSQATDIEVSSQRLEVLLHVLDFHYSSPVKTYSFQPQEYAARLKLIIKSQSGRRIFGEEPVLMSMLTEVVQEDLFYDLTSLLTKKNISKEVAIRNKELQGWNDFSKILYYFERKMDKFSVVAALFYYVHLGRLYLRVSPLIDKVG